jgi:hypothetical protein
MKKVVFCLALLCLFFTANALAGDVSTPVINGKIALMDLEAGAGKMYLTCAVEEEEKQIRFFVFDENKWEEILLPAETRAGGFLQLRIYNEIPFILFDGYDGLTLIRYENSTWYQVGKPGFASDISGLNDLGYLIKDGTPYLVFENSATKKPELMMLETNGNLQIWTSPDAAAFIPANTEQPGICMDLNQFLYTVWFDRKNEKVQVSKLIQDDEQLEDMSKGIPSKDVANLVGLFAIGNQLFLAYEDKTKGYSTSILVYNEGAAKWVPLTTPPSLSGSNFCISENKTIFMLNESGIPVRFEHTNNSWSAAEPLYENSCAGLEVCADGIHTYCAFLDANASNKLIIKQF